MPLNPATDAALQGPAPLIAGLLEIEFPGYTLRLCDGSGEIDNAGTRFRGYDDRFGTVAATGPVESGEGDQAPSLDLVFLPPSTTAAADLAAPGMQFSRVRCWLAAVNPATGTVIGAAERFFFGLVDTVEIAVDRGSREVNVQCVSAFERFFADDEGQRLADAYHQSIWPGELGLSNVTGITKNVPWGVEGPPRFTGLASGSGGLIGSARFDYRFNQK